MCSARDLAALACVLVSLPAAPASAQNPPAKRAGPLRDRAPFVRAIDPPSIVVGGETSCTVSGRNLAGVERWLVSGERVQVIRQIPKSAEELEIVVAAEVGAATGLRDVHALGPSGISNLAVLQVDTRPQVIETEPNNTPGDAGVLESDTVVIGTLTPADVDHFRVHLEAGRAVTIEVEAHRLAQPLVPVLSVLNTEGASLAQASTTRGLHQDARLRFTPPAAGIYTLQVRDANYGGGPKARYRLHYSKAPFATALFPLGGMPGFPVELKASGGCLDAARAKTVTLPLLPGTHFDPGPFSGDLGDVTVPMKLLVGDETPELIETEATATSVGMLVTGDMRVHGRVHQPGEVDRFRLPVRRSERLSIRIRAAEVGSWLDSVLRVVDDEGKILAENDDGGISDDVQPNLNPFAAQPAASPDSCLVVIAPNDGSIIVEVSDRYGQGGEEYGYRLDIGQSSPDFQISMIFGDPNLAQRPAFGQRRQPPRGIGAGGSLNLRPGANLTLNFLVTTEGTLSSVQVEAQGLPAGVSANPVTVNIPPSPRNRANAAAVTGGAVVLRAERDAAANLGRLRIVGRAKSGGDQPEIMRVASARIVIDQPDPNTASVSIPATRILHEFPLWIAGSATTTAGAPGTPAKPESAGVTLREVMVPGALLQGSQFELPVSLDPPYARGGSFELTASSDSPGITVSTLVTQGSAAANSEVPPAIVRVAAAPDAPVGVATVTVRAENAGGPTSIHEVPVVVRAPATLRASPTRLVFDENGRATLSAFLLREPGCTAATELQASMPGGLEVVEPPPWVIGPGEDRLNLTLARSTPGAEAGDGAIALEGIVRMPRGSVSIISQVRPMFSRPRADERDDAMSNNQPRPDVGAERP